MNKSKNENFAYIKLNKKIVTWDSLKKVSKEYDKIEIINSHNNLKNGNLVRIRGYVKVDYRIFTKVLGNVLLNDKIPSNFRKGIQSLLYGNNIPYKVLKLIIGYQVSTTEDLGVPNEWGEILNNMIG